MFLSDQLNSIREPEKYLNKNTASFLLRFLLTFNVFEYAFFDKSHQDDWYAYMHLQVLSQRLVHQNGFDFRRIKDFACHFADRYEVDKYENGNEFYKSLKMCGKIKDDVLATLKYAKTGVLPSKYSNYRFSTKINEDMIYHCLEIAYRYRNNLFHGKKATSTLDKFYKEFEEIINMMTYILEYANNHQDLIPEANRNN